LVYGPERERETLVPTGFSHGIVDIVGNTFDKVIFIKNNGNVAISDGSPLAEAMQG